MRLLSLLSLGLFAVVANAQTAAPFPPLIYTYQGASVPSSLKNAISTAGAQAESILAASGTDTATALVGAFPTTATVADTNSPVAATSVMAFSSASPGEVLSTATRAAYTKIGTVDTSMAAGTLGASSKPHSGAGRIGVPAKEAVVAFAAVAVGVAAGAARLL